MAECFIFTLFVPNKTGLHQCQTHVFIDNNGSDYDCILSPKECTKYDDRMIIYT